MLLQENQAWWTPPAGTMWAPLGRLPVTVERIVRFSPARLKPGEAPEIAVVRLANGASDYAELADLQQEGA